MWAHIASWLNAIPLTDPIQRRQALLLQNILLITIGAVSIGGGSHTIATLVATSTLKVSYLAYLILALCSGASLIVLRRGLFTTAIYLTAIGLVISISAPLYIVRIDQSGPIMIAYAVPIMLTSLTAGRRGALFITSLCGSFILIITAIGLLGGYQPGASSTTLRSPLMIAIIATFIMAVQLLFLDQFGMALRQALTKILVREQELEQLRSLLEQTVLERTASLEESLRAGVQRESQLVQTLSALDDSQALVRELHIPILPVLNGVLVVPMVGTFSESRAELLTQSVLQRVEHERARTVIFDVTGVPVVDIQVAQTLLVTATSIQLLGATTLLVGVRPEVAQTLTTLDADLSATRIYADLRDAVEALIQTSIQSSQSLTNQPRRYKAR